MKTNLTLDQLKELLKNNNMAIKSEARNSNNTGTRLDLNSGEVINLFDSKTIQIQGGGNRDKIIKLLDNSSELNENLNNSKVFVVFGHDKTARVELDAMLRKWNIEPIFLDEQISQGNTIIEKLEYYTSDQHVDFAIVLLTPDDEGYKKGFPEEKKYRARQNVVLELGMMLSKLGRDRVAVLLKKVVDGELEKPTDIDGIIYIPFGEDLKKDVQVPLSKELRKKGYSSITIDNL